MRRLSFKRLICMDALMEREKEELSLSLEMPKTYLPISMADAPYLKCFVPKTEEQQKEEENTYKRYEETMSSLPREKGWFTEHIYRHQGFWYPSYYLPGVMVVQDQNHFQAHASDILLATSPKCGTTWFSAIVFAVVNRKLYTISSQKHPLCTFSPHDLVPRLEHTLYINNRIPDLDMLPSPRLLGTHIPYSSLPQSVLDLGCRVIYICRNPKDTFVSMWHFINKIRAAMSKSPLPLEEAFDMLCAGASDFGPFWDHALGYWRASLHRPQCVLFLKYEEMKADPAVHVERLAKFMGCPFSSEEVKEGVVDDIIRLCSFESLSSSEVNKPGSMLKFYFRQGKVGDSVNYLTSGMIERLEQITENKLHGSGLTLSV
ncbi:hypothetical protein HHK36_026106 [Tetracentron sinense]|uniref:Sulfotransferase n=1 Tax=Tetracentron sinense TaxID=13715 RepID=A0A834YLR6_TETSI|nr:hypothetical protein HHK36_026106 [Tetracentron sinense]